MNNFVKELEIQVKQGKQLKREEIWKLSTVKEIEVLSTSAERISIFFKGNTVELCSIINAKSGKCGEDCSYCAQSAHYATNVDEYELLSLSEILNKAMELEKNGVKRLSLVTSGRGLGGEDFIKILAIFSALKKQTALHLCASLGIISYEQAVKLKDVGVTRYHHNLESGPRFFSQICTTHTYQDRLDTIANVQKAGLEACCGGIIGLGETMQDRLEMALAIRDLQVKSVPLNILVPIRGTPLENIPTIQPQEVLKTMALFRFILPDAVIRYAGGRNTLGKLQERGFKGGINGVLVGNYLTTVGNNIKKDITMLKKLGFIVK